MDLRATPTDHLRRMATAASRQSDYAGAEVALREVARREPRDAEALLALAFAQHSQGARGEALVTARRAAAVAGVRNAQAQRVLGSMLTANGQFEAAARAFEASLRVEPNDVDTLTTYAITLERLRRPTEAHARAERALALHPACGEAMALLGQLAVNRGAHDEAETLFLRAITQAWDPPARATAWHHFGSLREAQHRWDEAFDCHDKGNRVQMSGAMGRHAGDGPAFPHLAAPMPDDAAAILARWAAARFDDGPADPVFLVGFPRSGTTLTEQVLAAIPGSVTSDEEPVFGGVVALARRMAGAQGGGGVGFELDGLTEDQIRQMRAEYWRSVDRLVGPGAARATVFVDKQPLRFVHAVLMNRMFPRGRIVFVARDPRDCCLSCLFQNLAPTGPMARSTSVEGIGDLYAEVMGFWVVVRKVLAMPVLELRYEDMVEDFATHARRLVEFVGQPWTDEVLRFHERASGRTIRTPSYRAVTEQVNTRAVGKWARYEKHLGPLVERVRPFLVEFGYQE